MKKLAPPLLGATVLLSFFSSESGAIEKPIHANKTAMVKFRMAIKRLNITYPDELSNIIKPESS